MPRCARTPARSGASLRSKRHVRAEASLRSTLGVVALALFAVGGCAKNAAPPLYFKPGVEADVRKRDEVECTQASFVNRPGPATGVSVERDRGAYDACMKGRGYTVVKD